MNESDIRNVHRVADRLEMILSPGDQKQEAELYQQRTGLAGLGSLMEWLQEYLRCGYKQQKVDSGTEGHGHKIMFLKQASRG